MSAMPSKNESQLQYFMDVVLRSYCRSAEENDVLYQEMQDLQQCLVNLYRENADLRLKLTQAGVEVLPADFTPSTEEMAELYSHI